MTELEIRPAVPADAEVVVSVIHRAFAARPVLDPPTPQLSDSVDQIRATIETSGGLLVLVDGEPAGTVLFDDSRHGELGLRRVSVEPSRQGRGVATAMVGVAEEWARARDRHTVTLTARRELGSTVAFWHHRGYRLLPALAGDPPYQLRLGKVLDVPARLEVPDADAMELLGRVLAGELRAGDLVLLVGELGAGKTTLTRGIGAGLEISGTVTSPTFVIARHHRPGRPGAIGLVHVDAYRLDGAAELDDLDLDAAAPTSVTVVEWGEGVADGLSDQRLVVRLERPVGTADGDGADAPRRVELVPHGHRWAAGGVLGRIGHRFTELLLDREATA